MDGAIVETNRTKNRILKTNNMKHATNLFARRSLLLVFFLSIFSLAVWSQEQGSGSGGSESSSTSTTEKKTSINITSNDSTGNTAWYTSPWVWVVGAAVFILLLVALLSNRGRDSVSTTDRVRVTKTVERDRDPDV